MKFLEALWLYFKAIFIDGLGPVYLFFDIVGIILVYTPNFYNDNRISGTQIQTIGLIIAFTSYTIANYRLYWQYRAAPRITFDVKFNNAYINEGNDITLVDCSFRENIILNLEFDAQVVNDGDATSVTIVCPFIYLADPRTRGKQFVGIPSSDISLTYSKGERYASEPVDNPFYLQLNQPKDRLHIVAQFNISVTQIEESIGAFRNMEVVYAKIGVKLKEQKYIYKVVKCDLSKLMDDIEQHYVRKMKSLNQPGMNFPNNLSASITRYLRGPGNSK